MKYRVENSDASKGCSPGDLQGHEELGANSLNMRSLILVNVSKTKYSTSKIIVMIIIIIIMIVSHLHCSSLISHPT